VSSALALDNGLAKTCGNHFRARSLSGLALDNGLAKTPPMGWNSWNKFGYSA